MAHRRYVPAEPNTWRTWLVQNGVASLVGAIGVAMMGLLDFWIGLIFSTAAAAFYAYDLWGQRRRRSIALVIIVYVVIIWLAFVPAPLIVLVQPSDGNYLTDSEHLGIKWKSEYYPVNLVLTNETKNDFEKFYLYIQVSKPMAEVGVGKSINTCVPSIDTPKVHFSLSQITANGTTIPLFGEGSDKTSSPYYKIRCDKVAANSNVEFVFAVLSGKPEWATIQATFFAAGRDRVQVLPKCFSGSCLAMPKLLW